MKLPRVANFALVLTLGTPLLISAADSVPFHAAIDTRPAVVGGCGPTCVTLDIPGSGTATHLGAVSMNGPSQVDLATGQQTASSTLTAANGDELVLDIVGSVQFTGGPTDPVTFTGTWEVASGTGRFEGASGQGAYTGAATIPAGGTLTLTGTISRRGK